jgi:hypothetical protein
VAAALPGGEPWIVTAPLGRGRTVLIATDGALSSVDSETGEPWTAWPTWPSFLPVVREIMAYAVGGQREMGQQPVGSPLAQRDREPLRVGEVVEVTRPDGRTGTARVENGPDGGVWNYSETDHSGIYSVRAAGSAAPQPYAINLNTAESDLAKVDPSQLPPELSIRAIPQAAAGGIASDLAAGDLLPRSNWQQTFLLGAFGLLLVESLLAWHFGRGVL